MTFYYYCNLNIIFIKCNKFKLFILTLQPSLYLFIYLFILKQLNYFITHIHMIYIWYEYKLKLIRISSHITNRIILIATRLDVLNKNYYAAHSPHVCRYFIEKENKFDGL